MTWIDCINKVPHNIDTPYKTLEEYKKPNLYNFGLGSQMHLKLDPCVSYTHWGIHHTHLRTLFYGDCS
jgi:hypothetical protein